MILEKNEENCLKIIESLNKIFILSDTTKKEMYDKLLLLSKEDRINITKNIVNHLEKQKIKEKELLIKVNAKKNNIEELIDTDKEEKINNSILNNI